MRRIKTTTGAEIILDGDPVGVVEALYLEVTVRQDLDRSVDQLSGEIAHLVAQMSVKERQDYLRASLLLNSVTYENGRLGAYARRMVQACSTRDSSELV